MQRVTTSHNESKQATTSHNEPQRSTTNHNKPQRPTMTHNDPQQPTTTHNEPQLWHKMNKTQKTLHSLVYAFSPLNSLNTKFLMKIVLMLVPRVRSARRHLPASGTHTMFRHHSACCGNILLCALYYGLGS